MQGLEGKVSLQVSDTTLDDGIGRAISKLVPAVHRSDGNLGKLLLNLLNSAKQSLGSETLSVENFGADGDGVNNILVSGDRCFQGGEVLVERLIVIGPTKGEMLET
jgi:hypothetical protein